MAFRNGPQGAARDDFVLRLNPGRVLSWFKRIARNGTQVAQLYPFTDPTQAPPRAMVSGEGCRVTDAEGNTFIDAVSGLWCAGLGFSEERLIEAAARQMRDLPYYHSFMGRTAETTERLAAKLAAMLTGTMAGDGSPRLFFANSGSEAVDTAVKLARSRSNALGRPEAKRVIAREGAYHGSGAVSAGLTAMSYCHDAFDLPDDLVLRTGSPHHRAHARAGESERAFSARRAAELDALIREAGPETMCAMIAEPVIGSGGVIPPPEGYWPAIREVLDRHGVLLIADEIITGFGRTGAWFGSDLHGMQPDLMTMAKQLTAAYFPMSAVAVSASVAADIDAQSSRLGTFGHGFTYGGHPVGAAVALEAIAIYEDMDAPSRARALGELLEAGLAPVRAVPGVAEFRRAGLMVGIEVDLAHGLDGPTVGAAAETRGLLVRVIGNTLALSPPLNTREADIDRIADTFHDALLDASGAREAAE